MSGHAILIITHTYHHVNGLNLCALEESPSDTNTLYMYTPASVQAFGQVHWMLECG